MSDVPKIKYMIMIHMLILVFKYFDDIIKLKFVLTANQIP